MKKKKTIIIRIRKLAPKRFLIEQQRTFMFFWKFFQKGCPSLGLKTYYSGKQVAKTAIQSKAAKKNVRPIIMIQ